MSFILDALKKSEADRQQRSAPDISDVPTDTRKAVSHRWWWILAGLLGVNLVVLTVVLINQADVAQPTAVASDAGRVAEPVRESIPMPETQVAARRKITPQTEQLDTSARAPQAPAEIPARDSPIQRPTPEVTETQLTFNDLRASGNLNLPDLTIDIHVYSEKPADRFVFINMHQYRENAILAEGPLLREITTEGVVLEFVGATFLLPRD